MRLSDQVAELENNLRKARCNAAYWKVQCAFLKNLCKQHGIDLDKYYAEVEIPEELK